MEVVLKGIGNAFDPMQITMTRFFVGGLALVPFALLAIRKRQVVPTGSDLLHCALFGFLCVFVSMGFFQLAVLKAPASVVAVLFSCNPVFVFVFSRLVLGSVIRREQYIALFFQLVGLAFIIDPLGRDLNIYGCLLTLLSAATFALYAVCGAKTSLRLSGPVVTCLSFIFGSLEMAAIAAIGHLPQASGILSALGLDIMVNVPFLAGYDASNILTMLYIYVGVTGLGYVFYFMSMELADSTTSSLVFFFKPVLAPLLAWAWLGEEIPLPMKIGIALILAGPAVNLWKRGSKK